jgi:threonine dehydrogenase-like Zn-dependent dehydrogenase
MRTTEIARVSIGPATPKPTTMKALVYHGPGKCAWEDKPRPTIQAPGDAIVRITTSTICGTDLHILKGDLPAVTDGRILGHEGIGVVEQVRAAVSEFEGGVLNGQVKPGDTVAIVGAGPAGLAVLLTAQFYSPAAIIMIDLDEKRLAVAKKFGATTVINSTDGTAAQHVMELTEKAGVDVAIEAVGVPATFAICQEIVAAGGRIANVGVHGKAVELHLEKLWDRNIAITTRLVDTVTTSMLLKVVRAGTLEPSQLVTHRFALKDIMKAYDTFGNAAKEGALKVVLKNGGAR